MAKEISVTITIVKRLLESGDEVKLDKINQIRSLLEQSVAAARLFLESTQGLEEKSSNAKLVFNDALLTPVINSERYEEIIFALEGLHEASFKSAQITSPLTNTIVENWTILAKIVQSEPLLQDLLYETASLGLTLSSQVLGIRVAMLGFSSSLGQAVRVVRERQDHYTREVWSKLDTSSKLYDILKEMREGAESWLSTLETELLAIDELVLK